MNKVHVLITLIISINSSRVSRFLRLLQDWPTVIKSPSVIIMSPLIFRDRKRKLSSIFTGKNCR